MGKHTYIVFGDTHACPEALEAILASGVKMGVDVFVSLGDVFGYGPSPIKRGINSGEDNDKKGCLELLEDRFYEKRIAKDGSANYILVPNRHLLLGNHDRMFLTGERPEYIDGNAEKGIEWAWKQIGIEEPVVPGEADKKLEGIRQYMKRPKKTWRRWLSDKLKGIPSNYISPEEQREMEKNMSPEDRGKKRQYDKLKEQEEKFKPYHDLLTLWKPELVLEDIKSMFAHAFPPSLAEHADQLGIDKNAISFLEVYIVSRDEWENYAAKNFEVDEDSLKIVEDYVKGKNKDFPDLGLGRKMTQELIGARKRRAIAEEVVELLPEGYTLFIGHAHRDLIISGKDGRNIYRPGAGFNPRAKPGDDEYDRANFICFDDPEKVSEGFYRIKYNRAEVDREMEAVKNAR